MISDNWAGVSFSPFLMRPAQDWADAWRAVPDNVLRWDCRERGPVRLICSGFHPLETVQSPGILELEELLEELFLLFREPSGSLEVYHHHQIAGGFAP
jgi:hypothetical protein